MFRLLVNLSFSVTVCSMLFPQTANAWGDIGHQTVAEVAQRFLTPQARKAVEDVLGPEPMAAAAIWPDIVRSDKRFAGFAPYHFVEIPKGFTYATLPHDKHVPKDGMTVLAKYPAIVTNPATSRSEKMIALRYIIHVTGDLHQPLHVGNGLDFGANLCDVVWNDSCTGKKTTTNLHSVWDETLIDFVKQTQKEKEPRKFFGFDAFADLIIATHADVLKNKSEIETAAPEKWLAETQALRETVVYPDAKVYDDEKDREYCVLKGVRNTIDPKVRPEVGREYALKSIPVVETQILKGGLRLAYLLNTIFANVPPVPGKTDLEIINELLVTNF